MVHNTYIILKVLGRQIFTHLTMKSTGFLEIVPCSKIVAKIWRRGINSKCWILTQGGAFATYMLFQVFVSFSWCLYPASKKRHIASFNWVQSLRLTQWLGSVSSSTQLCPGKRENEWISNRPYDKQANSRLICKVEAPCNQAAWAGSCRWKQWGSSLALSLRSGCKRVGPGPERKSDADVE